MYLPDLKIIKEEDLKYLHKKEFYTKKMLSDIYNVSVSKIRKLFEEYKIQPNKSNDRRMFLIDKNKPTYKELYKLYIIDEIKMKDIGKIYDVGFTIIERWFKEYNIPKRDPGVYTEKRFERQKETCLKKHGTEYFFQTEEFKEKSKQTWSDNLGVENPMQSEEIKDKAKQRNKENLGVEWPLESKKVQEKQCNTNIKKYGRKYIKQQHIKNFEIWDNEKLFKEWIIETYDKLGRVLTTGDLNNYFNLSETSTTAPNRLRKLPQEYTKYYRINESYFELLIENWLKSNNIAYIRNKYYDFMRNNNGNMMQLDFYIPNKQIAIEMNDNWSHNVEFMMKNRKISREEAENYHKLKTDLCAKQNIQLIHIYEKDLDNLDVILNILI
jgi:hypothetical protein